MKKLIIFDMDGTLLNTIEDLTDATNYALEKSNLPTHSVETVKGFVGNGMEKLIERAGGNKKVLEDFLAYYSKHSKIKTRPYDGLTEVLAELKKRGIILAVNTNKNHEPAQVLTEEYFPKTFDYTCGAKPENGIKPSPDGVFEIMKKFGCTAEETIYIGDSDVDYLTGKNAGVFTISVTWGFKTKEFLESQGATVFIDRPEELLKYL